MAIEKIRQNTPLKNLKRIFPDVKDVLIKTGHAPLAGIISEMSNPDKLTLSNIARAAGYTELEIGFLIEALNERQEYELALTSNTSKTAKSKTPKKEKPKPTLTPKKSKRR